MRGGAVTTAINVVAAFSLIGGAAASLGTDTGALGAGADQVSACDADGIDIRFVPDGMLLDAVVVDDIDTACAGSDIQVTTGNVTRTATIGQDETSVEVDFSDAEVDLRTIDEVAATIA